MKDNKWAFLSVIFLMILTACSPSVSEPTETSIPSTSTPFSTETPIPTATATEIPATATKKVDIVTGNVYGHTIKLEMESSYIAPNEGTVSKITDALLTALRQGEYADKGFVSNEEFINWIYGDENPAGAGKLAWQRPVDKPGFVSTGNGVNDQVVWEEQPVWHLDEGIIWETNFDATSVPNGIQSEVPTYWDGKLWSAAIVDELNRLHVYAAQEEVALAMAHPANTDAEKLMFLQDIPTRCLKYFGVLAHHADGASALIGGYGATSSSLKLQAKTWFNYDTNWGQE